MNDPGSQAPLAAEAPSEDSQGEQEELERLRGRIDQVDRAILAELDRRAALVRRVGELKRAARRSVYRASRERDLIAALEARCRGDFPRRGVAPVFREIISATRSLEAELRVAYLGPEGTFSQLAARESFGQSVELLAVRSIPDVFAAVERGEAEHGLVPVENTTEGVVTTTLDTLLQSSVRACGERLLHISHQLLSRAGSLEAVRRVASHPQPLAQCRTWLDRHLPHAERVETASTAAAASLADEDAGVAAIASALVGELRQLPTLARAIEDRRDNTTRFLVLGGDPPEPSGNDLTCVAFTVRKSQAGALHQLLGPFSQHGVNLTSIQARPLKGAPWEYVFFLDLEGHVEEPDVQAALDAAGRVAHSYRVLGSFPRAIPVASRVEEPA
mgnify:CR=1 FL=1